MLYWIEGTGFCPLDKGLLEKAYELQIYRCPRCGNKYAYVLDKKIMEEISGLSYALVRPKTIISPRSSALQEEKTVFQLHLTL